MIIFEEKMFNVNSVTFAEIIDHFNPKQEYSNSVLKVYLVPGTYIIDYLNFTYSSHQTAISKLNELKDAINACK